MPGQPERKGQTTKGIPATPPFQSAEQSGATAVLSEDDVKDYLVNHPRTLVAALEDALLRYHEVLPVAEKILVLVRLGVLAGLVPRHQQVQFLIRLAEGADEKQRMAEYCLNGVNRLFRTDESGKQYIQKGRHFFESGSTLVYLIGALARLIQGSQPRKPLSQVEVLTNNLLSLTAFIGLIEKVEHLRGRLDPKYFGFLPFQEEESGDGDGEDEAVKVEEIVSEIKSCHSVFVTCSNFSFLAGPVVGSRANALVKRSIHLGKQMWGRESNRSYYLLFHFAKIIPIQPPSGGRSFDQPKLRCRPVFAAPQEFSLPSEVNSASPQPQAVADLNADVDGPTWHQYFLSANKVIRCPATELDAKIKCHDQVNHRPYPLDLGGAWIDNLSKDTRILVGLPHDLVNERPNGYMEAFEMLQKEVTTATRFIGAQKGHTVGEKYTILTRKEDLDKTNGVVEIRVN